MGKGRQVGGRILAIWLLLSLMGAAPPPSVQFTDVTSVVHLDFKHESSATSNKYLIETMGGGVALLDYDNDGRLDIFFTNGAKVDDPMPDGKAADKSDSKFWNRLYHQNPDGTFTDVTEKAGLTGIPQNHYDMGVAVGDYDNDGFEDIYITGFGGNTLYHNNGNGTFTDVTKAAGVAGGEWSASAGFFDYDNDGKLDLLVTRYIDWTYKTNRYCGERKPGYRAYCHPDNYDGVTDILYHNNGDGTFTDVSKKAGVANPNGKGLGCSFADYDGDGFTDIFVANDSVQCFLYHNNGNGTFSEVGLLAGVGFNEDGGAPSRAWARISQTSIMTAFPTSWSQTFPTSATCSFAITATSASGRHQPLGRRCCNDGLFRMEHSPVRLRQRWMEGPLRGTGARDGYDPADLS